MNIAVRIILPVVLLAGAMAIPFVYTFFSLRKEIKKEREKDQKNAPKK